MLRKTALVQTTVPGHHPLEFTKVVQSIPRGGTPGNSLWGCAARFTKSRPDFRPKNVIFHTRFQTRPLKSITVFRPGLQTEIMLSILQSHFEFAYLSFFLTHLELKRYYVHIIPWFSEKPYPIPETTKTAQKPYPIGPPKPNYSLYKGVPPPPPPPPAPPPPAPAPHPLGPPKPTFSLFKGDPPPPPGRVFSYPQSHRILYWIKSEQRMKMFAGTDTEGSRDGLASPAEFCKPAGLCVACEQQAHFRSSLLSLRKIGGREAKTWKRVYCSQARLCVEFDHVLYMCDSA